MTDNIYALTARLSRLRRLVERYPDVFSGVNIFRLRVPPGWMAVLDFALENAASTFRKRVSIQSLQVVDGMLVVDFSAGTPEAREEFRALLAEAREYCPCCGNLWPAGDREKTLAE